MLGVFLPVAGSALVLALPGQADTNNPYVTEASIVVCPTAPAGWSLPAGETGRFVLTPLSQSNENPGGTSVQVTCKYFEKKGGGLMQVAVRYALTSNLNPVADFAIGCTASSATTRVAVPKAWDPANRTYIVASPTSWSYATFTDSYNALPGKLLGTFETIARSLLDTAQPIAHSCALEVGPAAHWRFAFNARVTSNGLVTAARASGSFETKPHLRGFLELADLSARDMVVTVVQASKRVGAVTFSFVKPVSFEESSGESFQALLKVSASTYAPCRTGVSGRLTVSTAAHTVTLQACGRNLLQGPGKVTESITR